VKFNFHSATIDDGFDPAKQLQNFETLNQVRDRRRRLLGALPEFGERGRALAMRLRECGFIGCRSAACPVCLRTLPTRICAVTKTVPVGFSIPTF